MNWQSKFQTLIMLIYISSSAWVCGLSSSIPLLLNTPHNFLIQAGLSDEIIPTSLNLLSPFNITLMCFYLIATPTVMWLLRPKRSVASDIAIGKSNEEMRRIDDVTGAFFERSITV